MFLRILFWLSSVKFVVGHCKMESCTAEDKNASTPMRLGLCFCDDACHEFSDCCKSVSHSKEVVSPTIQGIPHEMWSCKVTGMNHHKWTVVKCPEGHKYSQMCSSDYNPRENHYSVEVPVYSLKTRIFYRNIFCAYCYDDYHSLAPMSINVSCTRNYTFPRQVLSDFKRNASVLSQDNCVFHTNLTDGAYGRDCSPTVETCSNQEACPSYTFLVSDHRSKVYKNPECARCNNQTNYWCVQGTISSRFPPVYPILFNINWNFGSCNMPSSIWDIFERTCVGVDCKICNNSCEGFNCSQPPYDVNLAIQGYLTVGCLGISIGSLTLHIFAYYCCLQSHSFPRVVLNAFSWSLLLSQTLFLFGIEPFFTVSRFVCTMLAMLVHFFLLLTFFWTTALSYDVWKTISRFPKIERSPKALHRYIIYTWGCSAVLSLGAILADVTQIVPLKYRPFFGRDPGVCWFANSNALAVFFFFPATFVMCINICFFFLTVIWLYKQKTDEVFRKHSFGRKEAKRFWIYTKLFIIMGISWASAFGASFTNYLTLWYPFIFLNSLQGAYILFMFNFRGNLCCYPKTPPPTSKKTSLTKY